MDSHLKPPFFDRGDRSPDDSHVDDAFDEPAIGQQAYPLFKGPSFSSKLADIETVLGLVLCGFVTFMVVIFSIGGTLQILMYNRPAVPRWWWSWMAPLMTAIIYAQYKTLQIFIAVEELPPPRHVCVALNQRLWPPLVRPFVALWWIAQGAVIVIVAHLLVDGIQFPARSLLGQSIVMMMPLIVLFMAAYASTSFLLFALATLWRDEQFLLRVWRIRGLIDITIALVSMWLWRG